MTIRKNISFIVICTLLASVLQFAGLSVAAAKSKGFVKTLKPAKTKITLAKGKTAKVKVKVKVKGKSSKKFTVKATNKKVIKVTVKKSKVVIKAKKPGNSKIIIKSKAKNKKGKKLIRTIKVKVKSAGNSSYNEDENTPEEQESSDAVFDFYIKDPDINVGEETDVVFSAVINDASVDDEFPIVDENNEEVGYLYSESYDDSSAAENAFIGNATLYSDKETEKKYYVLIDGKKSSEYATAFFYKPFTEKETDDYIALQESITDLDSKTDYNDEAAARSAYNSVLSLVKKGKEQGTIKEYKENFPDITYTMSSGIICIYTAMKGNDIQSGSKAEIKQKSDVSMVLNDSFIEPGTSQIGSFEPFKSEFDTTTYDDAARAITRFNSSYEWNDNYDNGAVSVERAKNLDNYNIIIWNGHGFWNEDIHSVMWLGTKATKSNMEKYAHDLKEGALVTMEGDNPSFGLTSVFVNKYYNKLSFSNTLLYLGICGGAMDRVLADTFIRKGVSTVLGYTDEVSAGYNNRLSKSFFNALVSNQGVTVSKALETAKSKEGKKDNLFHIVQKTAEMIIVGDKNYTIKTYPKDKDDKYEIVLTWNQDPADMDSHLEGKTSTGDPFHVYYAESEAYDGDDLICVLNNDDVDGFGPETLAIKTTSNHTYYYYVNRFEGEGSVNLSKSVVKVYKNNVLKHTYRVTENKSQGDYWNVFAIKNGRFVEKNTITNEPDLGY